ncbi:TPA: hypothetical protein DIC39_00905 [Patescibacteria group bacterium]|nr:MAG: hypothetical protein A2047_04295 [Omnitrophica bacterium GWA2_41_15]HCU47608.1 hypothetical protein [Patescibacteria group bacterium]
MKKFLLILPIILLLGSSCNVSKTNQTNTLDDLSNQEVETSSFEDTLPESNNTPTIPLVSPKNSPPYPNQEPTSNSPQSDSSQIFLMRVKCKELGEQYNLQHPVNFSSGGAPLVDQFSYNEDLDTCLQYGGTFATSAYPTTYLYINDYLSGNEVLLFVSRRGSNGQDIKITSKPGDISTVQDFLSRQRLLFNE